MQVLHDIFESSSPPSIVVRHVIKSASKVYQREPLVIVHDCGAYFLAHQIIRADFEDTELASREMVDKAAMILM